jgi:acyl-coenzyme A thioesterase PaaI-like protein
VALLDAASVAEAMLEAVPFARTLDIHFSEVSVDNTAAVVVVAELPDNPAVHNHVGGPHAGAMFALGETASGAVVMAAFGDQLGRAVPLAVRAEIAYRKLAMGTVRATARLGRAVVEVVAELDAGVRPEFPVQVELCTVDGTPTAEMTVLWTLRPHR